jgi:hypothetical protein
MTVMMRSVGVRMGARPKPKTARDRAIEHGAHLAPQVRVDRGEVGLEPRSITDESTGRVLGVIQGDRVLDQLSRYCKRGEISKDHREAGERFAVLVERMEVSVRSNLNREIPGESADTGIITKGNMMRLAARREVDRIEEAVGPVLLPVLYCVAVDGCPAGEWAESVGKPVRHGIAALCLALDALVRYWADRAN